MTYRVGIDVGGTFTDLLMVSTDGPVAREKTLSTPSDYSRGIIDGLTSLAGGEGLTLEELLPLVTLVVHGTTVATNTLLTGAGALTGLLTTRGFRDALAMRRGVKERIYDNKYPPPPSLVGRHLRIPVSERTMYDGTLERATVQEDVHAAAKRLQEEGVEAVAICFLNSYANGSNERVALRAIEPLLAEVFVTASHELLPRVGFYDRISTTVLNAYTGPVMGRYLRAMAYRLEEGGFGGSLLVMLSSGGVAAVDVAARTPVAAIRSGPAGGAIAATRYRSEHDKIVTFDMGGTSLDTAVIVRGQVGRVQWADFERYRVAMPMVDLVSIGAGGGSIAWLDGAGLLRVGPRSAGADPGPACYGRGGSEPTVTDADLALGFINPSGLLGGRVRLDIEAAREALRTVIAQPLGLSVPEAALAVYDVVNVNMASATREFLHERGHDPSDFTLVAGGGAGPVHAAAVADDLGMARVLIPRDSAVLSAIGLLQADLRHDLVQTTFSFLDQIDPVALRETYRKLVARGRATLDSEGVPPSEENYVFSADLRYERQINEIEVFFEHAELEAESLEVLGARFHARHKELYGYDVPGSRVEFVNARVSALGRTPSLSLAAPKPGRLPRPHGRRTVVSSLVGSETVDIFQIESLTSTHRVEGPAIIEGESLSLFVPSGRTVEVNSDGDFLMTSRATADPAG